ANGQSPFDNTFGDPVVLYHKPSGTWVTVWLDGACGGQGLGGYKSLTPDDPNSWTHFCAFNEGSADRESGWADNNPSRRSLGDCTFPGTTLINPMRTSSPFILRMGAPLGAARQW